ncbi:MAG: YbaN family protein [Acidimicrobiia bacterium]|nr:YbaN family protein [Acidimicrobiia bacterium]
MASTHPSTTDRHIEPAQVVTSRLARAVYLVLGFVCLGLGIAGYVVPLLPGTVFLLMATFFFFRSNERMYNWVLNHPRFGPLIRNYRAGHGIPRRVKALAIGLIIISFAVSVFLVVDGVVARVILIACAVAVSTFILTRPTTEVVLGEDHGRLG